MPAGLFFSAVKKFPEPLGSEEGRQTKKYETKPVATLSHDFGLSIRLTYDFDLSSSYTRNSPAICLCHSLILLRSLSV